jgi:hypothetical protein
MSSLRGKGSRAQMMFQRKFVRIEGSARIPVDRGGQCGLFSSHGSEALAGQYSGDTFEKGGK